MDSSRIDTGNRSRGLLVAIALRQRRIMKESAKPSQGKATKLGLRIARWESDRLMRWTMQHCPKAKRICEIGPGRGHVCHWAKKRKLWYAAVDQSIASQRMLSVMGADRTVVSRVPPVPWIRADIYVLFALLEHMDGPKEAKQLIQSVYLTLDAGGIVSILVPDIRFDGRFFWENSYEHNYVTTMQRVCFLLEECGFEVVQKEMVVSGVRLPLGYLIAWPARVLRWLLVLLRPCSALGAVHKASMHTPLAFIVGRKPQ